MTYTTAQVAEKLGVDPSYVGVLVRGGKLQAKNKPEDGKRVVYKFDSKVVHEFKKTYASKRQKRRSTPQGPGEIRKALTNLEQKIDNLSQKIDNLYTLWS